MEKWKLLQGIGAWISAFAGVVFTIAALLGVWGVIGEEGQVLMKSLVSLAVVCFTGLVFIGLGRIGASSYSESGGSTVRAVLLIGMAFLTIPHAFVVLFAIWTDLMYGDLMGRALTSFFVLLIGSVVVSKAMDGIQHRGAPATPAPSQAVPMAPAAPAAPAAPIAPMTPAAPAAPATPLQAQFPQYPHRDTPPA